jgi:hypothetical protein
LDGGVNFFGYSNSAPSREIDFLGLSSFDGKFIAVYPRLEGADVKWSDFSFTIPELTWLGYLKIVRIPFEYEASIVYRVQCWPRSGFGSTPCPSAPHVAEFQINGSIPIPGSGIAHIGPNLYAIILGARFGPGAGLAANLGLAGAALSHQIYSVYDDRARQAILNLYQIGPTAICNSPKLRQALAGGGIL